MAQNILVAGGMGAVLNCALASYFTSATEFLAQQLFVQPVASMRVLLPALVGFVWGTLVLLVWHLLKAWVVRFLLDYNGWFLHPKRPVNKVSLAWRDRRRRKEGGREGGRVGGPSCSVARIHVVSARVCVYDTVYTHPPLCGVLLKCLWTCACTCTRVYYISLALPPMACSRCVAAPRAKPRRCFI